MATKHTRKESPAIKQMAVNSLLGAGAAICLVGWLTAFPEKGFRMSPGIQVVVFLLSISSGAGAIVSIAHLRGGNE